MTKDEFHMIMDSKPLYFKLIFYSDDDIYECISQSTKEVKREKRQFR